MDPMTLMAGASLVASLFGMSEQADVQEKQEKLANRQLELSEQEMYQQQQRVQEWNEKYGSVEHNLLNYVKGLDANKIYGAQEGAMKASYDTARKNIDSHLASRGFDVAGGVDAGMYIQLADSEAQATVQLQQKSEEYVMNAQQAVLNQNRQPNSTNTGVQNALGNQMQVNSNNFQQQQDSYADIAKSLGQGFKIAQKKYETNKGKTPQQGVAGTTSAGATTFVTNDIVRKEI